MKSLVDKAKARVKRIEDSLNKQPIYHYPGQKYFYLMAATEAGKVVALGPFMDESEATKRLAEFPDGEIFRYDTRDLSRATRQMKAELLSRGEVSPDEALRKMLHERGLEREEQREH